MVRQLVLFLILFLASYHGVAQQYLYQESYDVDSMLLILPGQEGEEKVNTLNALAVSLSFQDFELCKQYADEAMILAMEINFQEGVADAYRNLGHLNFYKSNYPEALNNYLEALQIYKQLNQRNTIGQLYYDIAKTHFIARNYEKVLEYGRMALEKFSERLKGGATVGSVRDTINVIAGLSLTYSCLGMHDKSLETRLTCLEVAEKNNFGMTEMVLNTLLAGAHYYWNGETDSAKVYFEKAVAYPDTNLSVQAMKYHTLFWFGVLKYSAGEFDTAVSYLQRSFNWFYEHGFLYWAMVLSSDLGNFYNKRSELLEAEQYYRKSERIFREMLERDSWYRHDSLKYIISYGQELYFPMPPKQMNEMMWQHGKPIYYRLYKINKARDRINEAMKYHEHYVKASDTLNKLIRNRENVELQTKYETEQKDQQIDYLSKENGFKDIQINQSRIIVIGLGVLVLLVVILAVVFVRQNRLRELQKSLLLQQKLFRLQMNPHFIFNSLASIQNFVVKQDSKRANIYLSRFSELVRNILDHSAREFITIEKEISTIENYLDLQKVRYGDAFDYRIDVDGAVDAENMQIPAMLMQPFIENAIEHGIKHKDSKGFIRIRFSLHENWILLEIEDDGVGRKRAGEILADREPGHQSMGTAITLERIRVLNKRLKKKITMEILDLKSAKDEPLGTKVIFTLPITSHQSLN